MDVKEALTKMPPCSLGKRYVFVTVVGLVTSFAETTLVDQQLMHASGGVNKFRKKEGEKEKKQMSKDARIYCTNEGIRGGKLRK